MPSRRCFPARLNSARPACVRPYPARLFASNIAVVLGLLLGFLLPGFGGSVAASAAPAPSPAEGEAVGSVDRVAGDVRGTKPERAPERLLVGDALVLHHLIETGEGSEAGMTLGEDGSLRLGASTQISLDEDVIDQASRRRSRISLLVGYLRLKVGELFSGEIDIETPTATVGIKGTELEVEVDEDGRTTVRVLSGVVTLLSRALGELVELGPGQSSVVEFGKAPSRPTSFERTSPETSPDSPGESGRPDENPRPEDQGSERRQPEEQGPDDPGPDDREPDDPARSDAAEGRVASCPARAQAGAALCLCGSYPAASVQVGASARIDGRPGGTVTSAAPGRVTVLLPENLAPGRHRIDLAGQGGGCEVEVLGLETSYKDHLKQGRATYLIMEILGSREKLRLRVSSSNPRVVRIKGGNDRVVTTSGGRRNRARLRVKAVGDGQAGLDIEILGLPPCPCASGPGG